MAGAAIVNLLLGGGGGAPAAPVVSGLIYPRKGLRPDKVRKRARATCLAPTSETFAYPTARLVPLVEALFHFRSKGLAETMGLDRIVFPGEAITVFSCRSAPAKAVTLEARGEWVLDGLLLHQVIPLTLV